MADDALKDETKARWEAAPSQMGQAMGAFSVAYVEAVNLARDGQLKRFCDLVERKNLDIDALMTLLDGDPLQMHINAPPMLFTDHSPNEPLTGELETVFRTSENNHASEANKINAKNEFEAGGGGLLWSVKDRFSLSVTHEDARDHKSSFEGELKMKMTMGRAETPVGVQVIVDGLKALYQEAVKANLILAQAKLKEIVARQVKLASKGEIEDQEKADAEAQDAAIKEQADEQERDNKAKGLEPDSERGDGDGRTDDLQTSEEETQ